jgi:hypothetical protein
MVADTLTKSRSDVSRPTDAFRNILGGRYVFSSWRYTTDTCSDVSRPTDAFRNICLGGQICIRNIVDAKLLNRVSLHRLFHVGATVYLPDIYESYFTLCIAQNSSLHRLFRMGESDEVRLSTDYFTWGRAIIQMIIYVFFMFVTS